MNPVLVPIRRILPLWAVGVALAWSVACRAAAEGPALAPDAAPVFEVAPAADASGPSPRPRVPRQRVRVVPGHGIDETVRRLTRGLDLDRVQQTKLREILWDEQRHARKVRENPAPGVSWPSATATIVDQTKARIRALLNDAQKAKYSVDVPRDQAAPAQADLQHWMQLREAKQQQDVASSK